MTNHFHLVIRTPKGNLVYGMKWLHNYRWSSYWYLRNPDSRPESLDPTGALRAAGNLSDTALGHRSYQADLRNYH